MTLLISLPRLEACEVDAATRAALGDYYDGDQPEYEISHLTGEAFIKALGESFGIDV